MKKNFNSEFINHLIVELKRGYLPITEALESYNGEVFEDNPIDKLNKLYPEGWSTPVCNEVLRDLEEQLGYKYPCTDMHKFYGWDIGRNLDACCNISFGTLIPHDKYLELTGRVEKRDYTGVKFITHIVKSPHTLYKGTKSDYSTDPVHDFSYSQEEVESRFSKGDWIEILESPISEIDLLKQRIDNLEDTYDTIDKRLVELQELLKPKSKQPPPPCQPYEPKFKVGDVVKSGELVLVVTETMKEGEFYFSGMVIKEECDDYPVGLISSTWVSNSFTKVNLNTHFI